MIENCKPFKELRPAQPRHLPKLTPIANTVTMQHMGTDHYSLDKEDQIVLVDRY